jgi:hypothetical protein
MERLYHATDHRDIKENKLRELQTRFDAVRERGYDENIYRRPIGLGVLFVVLLLFLYGLIYVMTLP